MLDAGFHVWILCDKIEALEVLPIDFEDKWSEHESWRQRLSKFSMQGELL
jgi:hypothetical protein